MEGGTEGINELMEPGAASAVRRIIEDAVEASGFELVLVQLRTEHGRRLLRLYIGRPEPPATETSSSPPAAGQAGVTLANCQALSREISALLDVEDPVSGAYTLEVSSPGLNRPLVRRGDFTRFAGRLVRIQTERLIGGQRHFAGRLQGMQDGFVLVQGASQLARVPYEAIRGARVEYEF